MSIRRYLTLILLSVITLVTFAAAIQGYRSSMVKATSVFDNELRSLTHVLINITDLSTQSLAPQPDAAFIYQIWQHNRLIVSSHPELKSAISEFKNEFSENNFLAQRWRTYGIFLGSENKWVLVAQPLNRRFELAEQMILAAVTPLILSIPLLAIIIFVLVSTGLRPLRRLSDNLRAKKADDLTPIIQKNQQNELSPVLETLNQLFERLNAAFSRERRFASDAAHELRTPLSVLKINAHNLALELNNNSTTNTNMQYLQQGIERMSHVVEQILLLNRTNPEQYQGQFKPINTASLCQTVIASLFPQIEAKKQEIELLGQGANIQGDEFSLGILLQNLISNASKYSPEGSMIRVTLKNVNNQDIIQVEDSGPGIDKTEYQRVFERFYRIGGDRHASNTPGCGLGLAISKHIAELHNATLKLSRSEQLSGLSVELLLPQGQFSE
ncbi:ATP-binding protein [Paraglaciecola arctica]|uniref:histidine kinase n=1 Tax=Paraglaciecola arctica BSs20135 TaxID=493475 RepID=K6YUP4_9ALTE|nr:ATP-binding protein [Paraglaciecola arctica]GAC21877.1 two-component system, OmpR family, sensor histidine kinase QseC [Paraglaciecola arctica BSs20135]